MQTQILHETENRGEAASRDWSTDTKPIRNQSRAPFLVKKRPKHDSKRRRQIYLPVAGLKNCHNEHDVPHTDKRHAIMCVAHAALRWT